MSGNGKAEVGGRSGVVLLASPCDTTDFVYHMLARGPGVDAVVLERPMARSELLRRRMKRLGLVTVAGQVVFQAGIVPLLKRVSRRRIAELKRELGHDDAPIPEALITRVESANDPSSVSLLLKLAPKVVVVNGTRILSPSLLSSVNAIFLNTHAGITPLYRGVHGGYWALVEGQPDHCGVTVHLVNEGIDTGAIVGQATIHPQRGDSFVTYPYLQIAEALPLLQNAVRDALAGTLHTQPAPAGRSRLWSHPTAGQYLWHRLRGVR